MAHVVARATTARKSEMARRFEGRARSQYYWHFGVLRAARGS